ncbi:hypothetical protein E3P91_01840 [Wallemia ichthyophaga]|nr:hypothetical protein E3P91_01840 [Wallemia ichthyophaga]
MAGPILAQSYINFYPKPLKSFRLLTFSSVFAKTSYKANFRSAASHSKSLVHGDRKTEVNPFEKSFGLQFNPGLSGSTVASAAAANVSSAATNASNPQMPLFTPGINSLLKSFDGSDNMHFTPFLNDNYPSEQTSQPQSQPQPPQLQIDQIAPPFQQHQQYAQVYPPRDTNKSPTQNTSPAGGKTRPKRSQSETTSDDSDEYVYAEKHPRRKNSSGSPNSTSNHKPWRDIDLGDESPQLIKPVGRAGNPSLYISEDGKELSHEERKQLMLNRNREAASRCRQRKKLWINQVQDQADSLQNENNSLKKEILQYRQQTLELREYCAELKLSIANNNTSS